MKVGGYNLWPVQVGGSLRGVKSGAGGAGGAGGYQFSIFSNPVGDTIANTTGPLGFQTGFILSGGPFSKGGTFRCTYFGTVSCTGTPTLRLEPYLTSGASPIADSGARLLTANLSNSGWKMEGLFALDEVGNIEDFGTVFYLSAGSLPPFVDTIMGVPASTTFSATNIGLQVTWSAADPANSISCHGAVLDYFPPNAHA
jgi:hypothetical protein